MFEYTAVLLAAGRGTRTGLHYNKAFYRLNPDTTVLDASIRIFENDVECRAVVIVCAPHEMEYVQQNYSGSKLLYCAGGQTRQESVQQGLQLVKTPYVMIHDAARPYVRTERIQDLKDTLQQYDACLLAVPSVDTVKIVDENGCIASTPDRKLVWNAQTPQAFRTDLIQEVHDLAQKNGYTGTDDCSLVEKFSDVPVRIVQGDTENKKITNPEDVL